MNKEQPKSPDRCEQFNLRNNLLFDRTNVKATGCKMLTLAQLPCPSHVLLSQACQ